MVFESFPKDRRVFQSFAVNFKGLNPSIDGENLRKLSSWGCSDSPLNQLYVWEKIVRTYTSCALIKKLDK